MANYEFVVGNHYQPFTFQEMLLPWVTYKDVYDKTAETMKEYSDKADVFKYLADSIDPEDAEAKALYEGYANTLKEYADDFEANGVSMNNQRGLLSLKRRFQGEIGRLVEADRRKKEDDKIREQMMLKDPSTIFATPVTKLSDYLDERNPNKYAVSGDSLYVKGVAAGKTAAGRRVTTGEGEKYMDDHYIDFFMQKGYSKETMDAFRRNAAAIPELQMAADDILKANGVPSNLKGKDLERARQQVLNGIIDGAATEIEHKLYENKEMMSLKEREELKMKQAELALKQAELVYTLAGLRNGKGKGSGSGTGEEDDGGNVTKDYLPRPVRTTKEIEDQTKLVNDWNKYSQYFKKDSKGNWRMTQEGKNRYNMGTGTGAIFTGTTSGLPHDGLFKDDGFVSFVNEHGLRGMATKNQYSQPNGIIDKYIESTKGVTDLTKAHEFTRGVSDLTAVRNLLSSLTNSKNEINVFERKKQGNTYTIVNTGDTIDLSNLSASDVSSALLVWGIHGNYLEAKVKVGKSADKKETKTVIIPLEAIDDATNKLINGNIGELKKIDNFLEKNNMDESASYTYNGVQYPVGLIKMEILNKAGDNFMQILRNYEVKKTEVEPGIYEPQ